MYREQSKSPEKIKIVSFSTAVLEKIKKVNVWKVVGKIFPAWAVVHLVVLYSWALVHFFTTGNWVFAVRAHAILTIILFMFWAAQLKV